MPNGIFIGNGVCMMERIDMFNALHGVGIKMKERIYVHPPLNGVMTDTLFLQNIPSIVVSHVLDPQPGEKILDMCASPGGKTTHIAMLMKDQGKIIALDRNRQRVQMLKKTIQRYDLKSVECMQKDSAQLIKDWEASMFDRILLDPPCSGLGNRPRFDTSDIDNSVFEEFHLYQRRLFTSAVHLLKEDGILVYSTCTFNPLENEENVHWALETFKGQIELVDQTPYLGSGGLKTSSLDEASLKKLQIFNPVTDGTIGFFIAKFRKLM